jgi:UDP-glucuronate 4-epimerase
MKILVTGAAGFIGYHLSNRLLKDNHHVVGIDSVNEYYDVSLKRERVNILNENTKFKFVESNLTDEKSLTKLFDEEGFEIVISLAAQPGVRYSISNPRAYIDSNIIGFFNILENCRHHDIKHLLFASSSSVYGLNTNEPFAVGQNVDHPISLYAATKKSNELMAHTYSHLYDIPCSGLRFFTVYGPWGRPDMAPIKFARSILYGETLYLYNHGDMYRSFTYVDDIVESIVKLIPVHPSRNLEWDGKKPDPASSPAQYRLYNIGSNARVHLRYFLTLLEENLGKKAIIQELGMQPGDVQNTSADTTKLEEATGFVPNVTIEDGVRQFVDWVKEYYVKGNREIPKV